MEGNRRINSRPGGLRTGIPQSPRWLAAKNRGAEADAIVSALETKAAAEHGVERLTQHTRRFDAAAIPIDAGYRADRDQRFDLARCWALNHRDVCSYEFRTRNRKE